MRAAPVTGFDRALTWYRLPLPADAQGVRFYLDPGAFNGGDEFFLRFADTPASVAAFLAKLHATPETTGAETLWSSESAAEPVPWRFDDSSRYAVYVYSIADNQNTSGGTVTVDRAANDPVVYVNATGAA